MSAQIVPARFALRRRTAAAWAALNEVLQKGEPGVEIDTGFGKSGDGVTAWNDLPYVMSGRMDIDGLEDGNCLAWSASAGRWTPVAKAALADIGLSADKTSVPVDDLDALTGTLFFAFDQAASGAPDVGFAYDATGIQLSGTAQRTQIVVLTADYLMTRTDDEDGTGWSPWVPLVGVQSVTGTAVDNTDPQNPVINLPGGGGLAASYASVMPGSSNFSTSSDRGNFQAIEYSTVEYDADSLWDSLNRRFVIQRSGIYAVSFQARSTGSSTLNMYVRVNGMQVALSAGYAGSGVDHVSIGTLFLSSGDYVEAWWFKTGSTEIYGSGDSEWGAAQRFRIAGPL